MALAIKKSNHFLVQARSQAQRDIERGGDEAGMQEEQVQLTFGRIIAFRQNVLIS